MKTKALTFVEIIIVMATFMLLITATVPQIVRLFFANEVEIAGQELTHVLRRAHVQSTQQVNQNAWGLAFDATGKTYTFFSGTSFVGRDTNYDNVYLLPETVSFDSITLTGAGTSVIFDQLTGETSQDGSIIVASSEGDTVTITINSLGIVTAN